MPRVFEKTKNKGGKTGSYRCSGCADPIVAGDKYFEWSFRYGGTYRQHSKHGRPKNSQLTQSKMSGVYSAIEAAEDAISSAETIEDMKDALNACKDSVEEVMQEYQDGIDSMISPDGAVAQQSQEKIDALESFKDELESVADNLEDFEEDEPEEPQVSEANQKWKAEEPEFASTEDLLVESDAHKAWAESKPDETDEEHETWVTDHANWEEARDQHIEDKRSEASDALGNLSI